MQIIGSDVYTLVIGLGKTGFSCANYLTTNNHQVKVADSRQSPPFLQQLTEKHPSVPVHLGDYDEFLCNNAKQIILSPGVPITEPVLQAAKTNGVPIISDIDLFRKAAKAPLVAITGSNAKSTVTSLVGDMAQRAGINVAVGGNLGVPALELLDDEVELYVMELSSFQLETTHHLNADVATVLNISADHMDRYNDLADYHRAKHRIFHGCKQVVENADDMLTKPLVPEAVNKRQFTLNTPDINQYGIRIYNNKSWLAYGEDRLIDVNKLSMQGTHNCANYLAAIALGDSVGIPRSAMFESMQHFVGLPHRCQYVASINGVDYINDSKGTNVGACIAAIEGFGKQIAGKVILLAGGVGKDADFSALIAPLKKYARMTLLYGQDRQIISQHLGTAIPHDTAVTLDSVLQQAHGLAQTGDVILFSPACASFDQFDSFEQRGSYFSTQVIQHLNSISEDAIKKFT